VNEVAHERRSIREKVLRLHQLLSGAETAPGTRDGEGTTQKKRSAPNGWNVNVGADESSTNVFTGPRRHVYQIFCTIHHLQAWVAESGFLEFQPVFAIP
jgi:hypothetical protein